MPTDKSTFFTSRQWDIKKQLIDQTGHAVYAILILLPVLLIPNTILGSTITALVCGIIREWEQWRKAENLHLFDRILDVSFFGIGGFIIGSILS